MKQKNNMFAFIDSKKKSIAFIQAKDKKQARRRTRLVSHLVDIPDDCKIKVIKHSGLCRAPIFFEKHLRALEDVIEDALAGA